MTSPPWTLKRANLLPTGNYLYKVGAHRAGTTAEVPGAFLEAAPTVILRTLDDLEYTIGDTWDSGDVGDNIHPARLDERQTGPFFSSADCQTVAGNVKNGRWNRTAKPTMHAYTPDGPFTPGLKYDIGGAVQSTPPHPLVLIPEVGIPAHWAKTSGGTLVSDPAALSRLIDDAWAHLATLNRPSGVPYLAGGPQCPSLRRVFLAAHSGGGVALGPAAMSSVATSVPTDLWLMDCTYTSGSKRSTSSSVDFGSSAGSWGPARSPAGRWLKLRCSR